MEHEGKQRVLVTGASGGIGRAFAEELARRGWQVTAVARREAQLDALLGTLKGDGHQRLAADLATVEGIDRVADEIQAGGYHLLINNAGVGTYGAFAETDLSRLLAMLRLNCEAITTLSHAYLAGARAGDALINVSSTLAFLPLPYSSLYSATKAFVTHLSECLWYEQKGRGVYVMGLCPGVTSTDFHTNAGGEASTAPSAAISQRPEQVVAEALAALERRADPNVITGIVNQAGAFSSRLLPRTAVLAMMGANGPR